MQESVFNGIDYDVPPSLSVVRDRTFKRNFPFYKNPVTSDPGTGSVITHTSIRLVVNNTEFIDPWNSWLHFMLAPVSCCYQSHYVHSLADVLEAITLIDRNGLEIERITSLNLLNSIVLAEKWGAPYLATSATTLISNETEHTQFTNIEGDPGLEIPIGNRYPGTLQDVAWEDRDSSGDPYAAEPPKIYEVNVPLNLLLGMFAVDKLLPPHLVSGMEIRLDWANASDVFIANINPNAALYQFYEEPTLETKIYTQNLYAQTALGIPKYTLSDIYIALDTYVLDTPVVTQLSEMYATTGIPIKFQTYTQTSHTYLDTADKVEYVSIPIEQSFTNATKVIVTSRVRSGGITLNADQRQFVPYLLGQPWIDNTSFSLRYNGVSYPHNPVTTGLSAYHQWLSAFGKNRLYMDVRGYTSENFLTNMGTTFVIDLNRSPYTFKIAGSAVSTESNRLSSGQRIDGTNPATLVLQLGAVPDTVWEEFRPANLSLFTREYRTVTSWVEHERVLVLKASGNRVIS